MEKSFGLFFYLKKENRSDDNKLKVYANYRESGISARYFG